MEDDLNFSKMEDDLRFFLMEDDLKIFKNEKQPHIIWKFKANGRRLIFFKIEDKIKKLQDCDKLR
jgi:hypothetical protein